MITARVFVNGKPSDEHLDPWRAAADDVRDLLTSLLEVPVAQAANRLNEIMKRVTFWGAVILAPTFVAGIYGQNFRSMPELRWQFGYPMAIAFMAAAGAGVWWFLKRKDRL